MRVVLDTNTVISGLLWRGPPRKLLDLARLKQVDLFTSLAMLDELHSVLERPKFAARLAAGAVDPSTLIVGYAALSHVIKAPQPIPPACRDPSDDEVLACAQAALADLIVTGDRDLLAIGRYKSIRIVNSADGIALLLKGTP